MAASRGDRKGSRRRRQARAVLELVESAREQWTAADLPPLSRRAERKIAQLKRWAA